MYRILSIAFILIFTFLFPLFTLAELDLLNCSSFKLTIISQGEEVEWEYENPDEFEIEIGDKVIKGEKAKQEVTQLFNKLSLTKDTDSTQVVDAVRSLGYEEFEQLVVKVKLHDEALWTWKWEN